MLETKILKIKSANHDRDYIVDNHYHDTYEVVYYKEGHGITTIDGTDYPFGPNQFAIVSPNTIHSEKSAHEVIKLTYIRFNTNKDDFILKSGVFNDTPNRIILKLINDINSEKKQVFSYSDDMADAYASVLALQIDRIQKDKSLNNVVNCYDYIETYIKCNINKKINGKLVAKGVNYNYDYFRKMFKSYFKVSINKYITDLKLENALVLLKSKKYTVVDVSKITGFNSPSHFITLFKQKHKVTPAVYLASVNLSNVDKDDAAYKVYDKIK